MKKIQRVGIDLDGTLCDYLTGVAPLIEEHYGLKPDLSKSYHHIEEVFGLTSETRPPNMRKTLYEELHAFRKLPQLEEDNQKLTWRLSERVVNTSIYIITARSGTETIVNDTLEWLHEHNFVFSDAFFVADKHILCKLIGIDVMIEDEPSQIFNLVEAGINVVVPDQPWNRGILDDPEERGWVKRVHDWKEMLHATEEFLS